MRGLGAVGKVPWHPFAIAAAVVLEWYATTVVHPVVPLRPLIVSGVLAGALWLLGTAVLRDRWRGSLFASAVLGLFASKQGLIAIERAAGQQPVVATVLLGAVFGIALILGRMWVQGRLPTAADTSRVVNALSALLLIVAGGTAFVNGLGSVVAQDLLLARTPIGQASASQRDIYVLILDAYPGASVAQSVFGVRDGSFERALESREFHVAQDSRSNYWFTSLSLASMVYGAHPFDVPALRPMTSGERPARPGWRLAMDHNPMFDRVRDHGYTILATSPGWEDVSMRSADVWLDGGSANEFEVAVLRSTYLGELVDWLFPTFFEDQLRARIDSSLDAVRDIALDRTAREPIFVWAHVPAPHAPLVVDADGVTLDWPGVDRLYGITVEQMGLSPSEYIARFRGQLDYVNERVLGIVDTIAESSGDAVIIIMSDHGPGNPSDLVNGEIDVSARLRNFFAARTPGASNPFPDRVTPVNVLTILMNASFGLELDPAEDASYRSTQFGTDELFTTLRPVDLDEYERAGR
jgi:hypothetical protein